MNKHMCIYIYVHAYAYVCMYACMYVCMYILLISTCMFIFIADLGSASLAGILLRHDPGSSSLRIIPAAPRSKGAISSMPGFFQSWVCVDTKR